MNQVQIRNIQEFATTFELAEDLQNSRFLITGATGLIGSTLINCLLSLGKDIDIIAPVRNLGKAQAIFNNCKVKLIECDLATFNYDSLGDIDYIVHCAAPTSSRYFMEHPVETASTIYQVSDTLLRYASKHAVKCYLYLSSMEVYGSIFGERIITEDMQGYLNPMDVRSSYPMAKRMVENLCCLYASEYGVNAKIARLTQTTGAGTAKNDNRAIVQFVRCAVENKHIVLQTEGGSARPYCYTIDAVSAMLYILLKGETGQAYNVANEDTYMSIRELAECVRRIINNNISVNTIINDIGYAAPSHLPLSTEKLKRLGWRPKYDMEALLLNMAEDLALELL